MKRSAKKIKCLVATPVGPNSDIRNVSDTVESVFHYMQEGQVAMLLIDDTRSQQPLSSLIAPRRNLLIIRTDTLVSSTVRSHNTRGLLFVKQMEAVRIATQEYNWDCLLRLDDDALIIGPNPHDDALAEFALHRDVGMLGAYLRRGDGSDKRPDLRKQGR